MSTSRPSWANRSGFTTSPGHTARTMVRPLTKPSETSCNNPASVPQVRLGYMLVKVADKDVAALIKSVQKLPRELYKSLTWDRGKELANLPRLICPRYAPGGGGMHPVAMRSERASRRVVLTGAGRQGDRGRRQGEKNRPRCQALRG
jgi:hypothetical protein